MGSKVVAARRKKRLNAAWGNALRNFTMLFVPAYATEFAILEKTVDFVAAWGGNTNSFRIEALRDENGDYTTRVYIRMPFAMKDASTIEDGEEIQAEQDRYV
jgi:hypothetical protein